MKPSIFLAMLSLILAMVLSACASPGAAKNNNDAGLALQNQGRHVEAVHEFDEAIRNDPRLADAYNNRAFSNIILGNYQRAFSDLNLAIDFNPQHAQAYSNRGFANITLGQYQLGIQDLDEAIRLAPGDAVAYENRAIAYTYLSMDVTAQEDINSAVALGSDPASIAQKIEQAKQDR